MSSAHKIISPLGARHVSSPYSELIGCISSTQTRITWFGPRQICSLLSAKVRFIHSAKSVINSVGASETSRPYPTQI